MPFPLFHPESDLPRPLAISREEFSQAFSAEDGHVERKTGIGTRALQEAVVAFSNSEGGVILIGVDDSGEVVGKQLTQGAEESIHRVVAAIRNPGRYDVQALSVDGGPVIVFSVERRIQGFAQTSSGRGPRPPRRDERSSIRL